MTTQRVREYEYYLVPNSMDPHTNECIARELSNLNDSAGNEVTFFDNKGVERSGWRVKHDTLMAFCKAALTDDRFKVTPFVKEGGGKPRVFNLPNIKRKSAKVKRLKKSMLK